MTQRPVVEPRRSHPSLHWGETGDPREDDIRGGEIRFGYLDGEPCAFIVQAGNVVYVPRHLLVLAYLDGWQGDHTSDAVRSILE